MRQHRPSHYTIPKRAHPIVQFIYKQIIQQQTTLSELEEKSGVNRNTIHSWRHRCIPSITNIDAVLGALGYKLSTKVLRTWEEDDEPKSRDNE